MGEAELLLELPVLSAKGCRLPQQLGFATLARPELFERFFEFALATDTGVTEIACLCHCCVLSLLAHLHVHETAIFPPGRFTSRDAKGMQQSELFTINSS